MKFALALAAPALLLAGSAVAAPREAPYRAGGSEPGWTLTIGQGLIRYVGDYGRTRLTTPAPPPRPSFNGVRYVSARIAVDITHARCHDEATDRDFADRVMVTIDRRTVTGCGGEQIAAPARIPVIEGNWRVESVDGTPVRGGRPATITFSDDRISGDSGCNRFSGSFQFKTGHLTTGPLLSTKMACARPVMLQEQAILDLFGKTLSVSENRDGKLVMSAGGTRTIVLAPVARRNR